MLSFGGLFIYNKFSTFIIASSAEEFILNCSSSEQDTQVIGCMNPIACNYNALANLQVVVHMLILAMIVMAIV